MSYISLLYKRRPKKFKIFRNNAYLALRTLLDTFRDSRNKNISNIQSNTNHRMKISLVFVEKTEIIIIDNNTFLTIVSPKGLPPDTKF